MQVIDIQNLTVCYEAVTALSDVSIQIDEREFVGVIGPNGGGKTTLAKTILGLLAPTSGQVKLDKNQKLGYVPQHTGFDRNFSISVEEVVLTGHLPSKIRMFKRFSAHDHNHAKEVMERLDIYSLRRRQIGKLSGGQLQKVLIARALMNHPTILLLDEPTASVDEASKKSIFQMLQQLNQQMTIIIITHDTKDLLNYVDKVVYINKTAHYHQVQEGNKRKFSIPEDNLECPIDWFIHGEEIQTRLMRKSKERT